MIERGEHLRLAREARQAFGVEREFSRQDFDRTSRASFASRAIHLAHAARADGFDDLVRSDAAPRG